MPDARSQIIDHVAPVSLLNRSRGSLLGLAIGDAVGTTVEFSSRGTFPPVTDLTGGGPFHLEPGQWTDDTSMALCLATSLVECNGFDPDDQMRRYTRWMNEGYLSSNGKCFDIGITVRSALLRYQRDASPFAGSTREHHAGNGCIMRLAPIAIFFLPDIEKVEHFAAESSRTTHRATECVDACRLFSRMLCRTLLGQSKDEILLGDADSFTGAERITAIAHGDYRSKEEAEIRGDGYVVNSLEAALWSFARTDNYRDAVLTAVNLGDDADTTGAVCGQLAGAHYGESGIRPEWLDRLTMRDEIALLAEQLSARTAR